MRASLQTFAAGIEGLDAFLTDAERQTALIGMLLDADRQKTLTPGEQELVRELSNSRTDRKRYMYAVAIVSLYGLLERLVDSLIERFVARMSAAVSSYEALPEAIKKHHMPLSIELVKAIIDDKFKRDSTEEQVVANLHSCLSGADKFQLNGAAFVLHRGNISLSKVTSYLNSVGIDSHFKKIVSAKTFVSFVQATEPERDLTNISDQDLTKILEPIDDLVERRNEVSHGVFNVDALESVSLLRDRIAFVSAYGRALHEVLSIESLRFEIQTAAAQSLGKPLIVFNNSIVCFEHASCAMSEGDILVATTPSSILPFRCSPILSIEIDKVRHQAIDLKTSTKFGMKVSFVASDAYEYTVLPKDTI
jgi:RiboL-PSP-HEPN